jgi:predicted dienelactone hydrolase
MRPLEVALLLVTVPVLMSFLLDRAMPAWAGWVRAAAVLLLIGQIAIEGQRWQLWPAYLVVLWLALSGFWPRLAMPGLWTGAAGLTLLLGAGTLASVLPVFKFPTPRGPHSIGTASLHLVDASRDERGHNRGGGRRELMIQFWYPAAQQGPAVPLRTLRDTTFKRSRLALVKTHASAGVPVSPASPRYPVLLFLPSWTGQRDQNNFQAEELASQGYVVVGIDHPFGCQLTVFPDGRRVPTVLGNWMDFASDETEAASKQLAEDELKARVADTRFVLDELARLDQNDPAGIFTGRLDLARVGIFGHSFGGAVAAEACRQDSRLVAGIDLDGCLFGLAASVGVPKPVLFASGDTPAPTAEAIMNAQGSRRRRLIFLDEDLRNVRRSLARYGGYYLKIRGTRHANFCDAPLESPWRRRTGAGPIDHARAMRIINDYTLAFFARHLHGQAEPLLTGPSADHPEVQFEEWPAAHEGEAVPPAP